MDFNEVNTQIEGQKNQKNDVSRQKEPVDDSASSIESPVEAAEKVPAVENNGGDCDDEDDESSVLMATLGVLKNDFLTFSKWLATQTRRLFSEKNLERLRAFWAVVWPILKFIGQKIAALTVFLSVHGYRLAVQLIKKIKEWSKSEPETSLNENHIPPSFSDQRLNSDAGLAQGLSPNEENHFALPSVSSGALDKVKAISPPAFSKERFSQTALPMITVQKSESFNYVEETPAPFAICELSVESDGVPSSPQRIENEQCEKAGPTPPSFDRQRFQDATELLPVVLMEPGESGGAFSPFDGQTGNSVITREAETSFNLVPPPFNNSTMNSDTQRAAEQEVPASSRSSAPLLFIAIAIIVGIPLLLVIIAGLSNTSHRSNNNYRPSNSYRSDSSYSESDYSSPSRPSVEYGVDTNGGGYFGVSDGNAGFGIAGDGNGNRGAAFSDGQGNSMAGFSDDRGNEVLGISGPDGTSVILYKDEYGNAGIIPVQ